MMTFVAGEPPSLKDAWFAVEGDPTAVRSARAMARALGAHSFTIQPGSKALYHAFGAMLSPMLATELAAAERVGLASRNQPSRRASHHGADRTAHSAKCFARRSGEVVQRTSGARRCPYRRPAPGVARRNA